MPRYRLLFLALAVPLAFGCSSSTAPTATTTQEFKGMLAVQSSNWLTVTTKQAGTLQVVLTNLSPAATIEIAIGDGSIGCSTLASTLASETGSSVSTQVSAGNYCLSVSDVGKLTVPVSYTLDVSHP